MTDERPPQDSIVSGAFWGRNPHGELRWLRENDPVYWDADGGVWGVTRYDHIKEVESDPATFSNAGGIRPDTGPIPMMIDMDDPEHRNRRKLVSKAFTPNRVREQEPHIHRIVHALVDEVCERGECDFIWDIAAWVPLIMIGDALGVEPEDRDDAAAVVGRPAARARAPTTSSSSTRRWTRSPGTTEYAARVIEDRRGCPRDDVMSVLVHAEVDGDRLDDDSILHESLLILIGGDETTRHVMSGGMYQLLVERERWERLKADRAPDRAGGRGDAPLGEPDQEHGAHRDPHRRAPRQDDRGGPEAAACSTRRPTATPTGSPTPTRSTWSASPNDHVAFGFGTHFCLGSSLARLELRALFEVLADRLPDLALAADGEPGHRAANFVSGYEAMPVTFTPTARRVEV